MVVIHEHDTFRILCALRSAYAIVEYGVHSVDLDRVGQFAVVFNADQRIIVNCESTAIRADVGAVPGDSKTIIRPVNAIEWPGRVGCRIGCDSSDGWYFRPPAPSLEQDLQT